MTQRQTQYQRVQAIRREAIPYRDLMRRLDDCGYSYNENYIRQVVSYQPALRHLNLDRVLSAIEKALNIP